ncbi:class I SAM-dependent methyltransferase [Azospirillum sp.]|uniref:class I SAM-dependent methyltransferase n=1 Tax=Azospirillum sp. TaxID=34012 RepID=UPI003D70AC38
MSFPLGAASNATPISCCRVCGNPALVPILDLGEHSLTGRFPRPDEKDPPSGPLALVMCDRSAAADGAACGTLQLSHDYEQSEMFGERYGYRSSVTETMRRHLHAKAHALVERAAPAAGDVVLDIGCNDGTLLRCYDGMGLRRIGIDPSSGPFVGSLPPDIELVIDFFSADRVRPLLGGAKLKIVTSIAMFYDLPDPVQFMREVRALLADDGIWEMEQSYMPLMLSELTYDTICHEHLTYYGLTQIAWMAERADLRILDASTNDVNGGSFRVQLTPRHGPRRPAPESERAIAALLAEEARSGLDSAAPHLTFAERISHHRDVVRDFFRLAEGKVVLGYGASTKGNVILQYCGVTTRELPAILERYAPKCGLVTPGSRIPIISEDEGRARRPDFLLVFPWHFRDEIVRREAAFLEAGGHLVFPLPRFEIVGKDGVLQSTALGKTAA